MRVTADTNVLLRAYVADDEGQAAIAVDLLAKADIVAVSLKALCEFAWVLARQYHTERETLPRRSGLAEHREWLSSAGRQLRQGCQSSMPAAISRTA